MNITTRTRVSDEFLASAVPDPLLRQILASRGLSSPEELQPDLKYLCHYRDLKDIDKAAALLCEAVREQHKIMIMGDYDVDGMTGTALGVHCLRAMHMPRDKVLYHVPSRYDDGYGLSCNSVQQAADKGVQLLVTVDNGIGCIEAIKLARELGMRTVVTDHHEPGAVLPPADAIVDPKQKDCAFASKNLCGVGVLFYVLLAVRAKLQECGYFTEDKPAPLMSQFLDFVAIGTVGDVVPLDANNRRLVKAGLMRMHKGRAHIGIRALAQTARVNLSNLTALNIAFDLCPRLNAAGRIKLEDNPAVDCLLSEDETGASYCAKRLELCNKRRCDYEKVFLVQAKEQAEQKAMPHSVVVYDSLWLSGLSGLLASRLKDQFSRPCFVFAGDSEEITGSARSVPGFPLAEVLASIDRKHPEVLLRYGGHAMAAGATIKRKNLEAFRTFFDEEAALYLQDGYSCQEMVTDGCLPESYLNLNFARALEECGPWGQGWPEPCFTGDFIIESVRLMGTSNLRFRLRGQKGCVSAIRFRASAREKTLYEGIKVRTVFSLGVDRYYSNDRLEVKLLSIEPV